jgi:hypothetical protein
MAATQIAKPFHRPGWIYEEKVDGWRVLAYKEAAGVRLMSRNAKDLTRRFPELAAAVTALKPPTLLLDGEIAVFDNQLISHFEWIRTQPKDEPATPPTLIAFDCLYTRGKDLRKRPLRVRWNVHEELVDGHALVLPARRLADDGLKARAQVLERRGQLYDLKEILGHSDIKMTARYAHLSPAHLRAGVDALDGLTGGHTDGHKVLESMPAQGIALRISARNQVAPVAQVDRAAVS